MPRANNPQGNAPVVRRGDIVRVRFDPVEGSEQGGERPALILSPDLINERSPVVLIVPLTSKKTERVYPFETLIEAGEGGLTQRSKALLLHVRGMDRWRIVGVYGRIEGETMRRVEEALHIAAGLTPL